MNCYPLDIIQPGENCTKTALFWKSPLGDWPYYEHVDELFFAGYQNLKQPQIAEDSKKY